MHWPSAGEQQTERIKSRGERLQRIAGDVCEGPICNLLSAVHSLLQTADAASMNREVIIAFVIIAHLDNYTLAHWRKTAMNSS